MVSRLVRRCLDLWWQSIGALRSILHSFSSVGGTLPWWVSWQRIRLQCGRLRFNPWVGKISWRREWQAHSSILIWKISQTEEPGMLQSLGSLRVGHDWVNNSFLPPRFLFSDQKWRGGRLGPARVETCPLQVHQPSNSGSPLVGT